MRSRNIRVRQILKAPHPTRSWCPQTHINTKAYHFKTWRFLPLTMRGHDNPGSPPEQTRMFLGCFLKVLSTRTRVTPSKRFHRCTGTNVSTKRSLFQVHGFLLFHLLWKSQPHSLTHYDIARFRPLPCVCRCPAIKCPSVHFATYPPKIV